jgi:hypothetical protein
MGIRARGVVLAVRLAFAPALRGLGVAPIAVALGVASGGAVLLSGTTAEGKSAYDSHYGFDRTWNAVLRLVRVDLGLKVLEKDEKSGFLLFEYRTTESQKVSNGSIELIRGTGARPDDVKVVAQLTQMPRYHEQVLLDGLARKMREDYGEPPEPRVIPPAAPDAGPPDGNPDNDNEDKEQN